MCADIWRSVAYLCCLCNPVAGAEHWAPDTLPPPLCHVHGHRGRCGCAGSGLSSCACCWWLRCPRGLRGEPAVHRWIDYPGPGRAEDSLVAKSIIVWYNCPAINHHLMKDEMFYFCWNGFRSAFLLRLSSYIHLGKREPLNLPEELHISSDLWKALRGGRKCCWVYIVWTAQLSLPPLWPNPKMCWREQAGGLI